MCMNVSVTNGRCLVCVSNIPVCTMFLSFSFVAYQDVWNKRPFFVVVVVVVQKIILYSHVQRKRVCVGFVCMWMNVRERERAIAQHILSLTSSSSPDRPHRNVYKCLLCAHHPMTTTFFPLIFSTWGAVSRPCGRGQSWGTLLCVHRIETVCVY